MKIRLHAMVGFLVLGILSALYAETPPVDILNTMGAHYSATLDWQTLELKIQVSAPVDNDSSVRNRASLVSRKENELKDFFPSIFPLCLHGIRLDTQTVLQQTMQANRDVSLALESLADQVELVSVQPAPNLKSLTIEYRLQIAKALNPILFEPQSPLDLPTLLDWQAPADYTGLIIYVQNDLAWYGNDLPTNLVPSLYPRLFDEDKRLLLDIYHMDPEALKIRAPFLYVDSIKNPRVELAGKKPLVVSARALYGDTPCDIMISRSDADILLYNRQTRAALQQGKIIVITNAAGLRQQLVR